MANAEGRYIGNTIKRRLAGKTVRRFKFFDLGALAVIGRSSAVAGLGIVRFSGRIAWTTWLFAHRLKLVDFQNRLAVAVEWTWNHFTRNESARLITGSFRSPVADYDNRSGPIDEKSVETGRSE